MQHQPFYDPLKSYEENFKEGPFGDFADSKVFKNVGEPQHEILGHKLFSRFGIPAGPLVNGRFVKAAFDKGFDICTYKTVRSAVYPCHPWPNVVPLEVGGDLTLEKSEAGVRVSKEYAEPFTITNSFGVPSFDPDFWQKDMAEAVSYAKKGQVVIGSFQGTSKGDGNVENYIKDFALTAKLVKQTGAKILEVNLSCPNEGVGHLLCFDLDRTRLVVEAIKNEIGNTPLVVKVAYYKDHSQLNKLIDMVGKMVQGVAAVNTMPTKVVNEKGEQALPGQGRLISGACGGGIKWAGLEMTSLLKQLREQKNLEYIILGVGGVTKPSDYKEYINAGADAVMSATGAMWDPYLAQEIKELNK